MEHSSTMQDLPTTRLETLRSMIRKHGNGVVYGDDEEPQIPMSTSCSIITAFLCKFPMDDLCPMSLQAFFERSDLVSSQRIMDCLEECGGKWVDDSAYGNEVMTIRNCPIMPNNITLGIASIQADMQEKVDELWEAYEACLAGISKLHDTLECSERIQRRVLLRQDDLQSHEQELYGDIGLVTQSIADLREELEIEANVCRRNHQSLIRRFSDLEVTLSSGSHVPNLEDELKSAADRESEQEAHLQQPDVCVPADPSIAPYSESSSTTEISCVDASQPHAVDIPEDEKTITSQRTMSTGRHDPHAVLISYISTLALCVSNLAARAIRSLSRLGCHISSAIQLTRQNLLWVVSGCFRTCYLLMSNIVRWRATVLSVIIIPPENAVIWLLCFCDAALRKMLGNIFVQEEIQPVISHPRHHRHPFWESTWAG